MEFVDRQIACLDCGQSFTFTAGEQEFFKRKGFREEPKRCKPCRANRNARRGLPGARPGAADESEPRDPRAAEPGMGDAVDDDIGNRLTPPAPTAAARGARPARDAVRGGGPREMFDATCAQCGVATRVPFRPTAGRPVYCRDCYQQGGGRGAM
jgi:CxxC-x17-CxxC domain-containing protein